MRGAERRSNPRNHQSRMGSGLLTWGSCVSSHLGQLFVRLEASSSSRPWCCRRWRAQIMSRPARRAAAKRLGLDMIEHAIRLLWSGVIGDGLLLWSAIQGSSRFGNLVCLPDQTHIRSSREATAPTFRLRRAGSRGRGHSSLRRLKPCNPSVRPPGSTETDLTSADWFSLRVRF